MICVYLYKVTSRVSELISDVPRLFPVQSRSRPGGHTSTQRRVKTCCRLFTLSPKSSTTPVSRSTGSFTRVKYLCFIPLVSVLITQHEVYTLDLHSWGQNQSVLLTSLHLIDVEIPLLICYGLWIYIDMQHSHCPSPSALMTSFHFCLNTNVSVTD